MPLRPQFQAPAPPPDAAPPGRHARPGKPLPLASGCSSGPGIARPEPETRCAAKPAPAHPLRGVLAPSVTQQTRAEDEGAGTDPKPTGPPRRAQAGPRPAPIPCAASPRGPGPRPCCPGCPAPAPLPLHAPCPPLPTTPSAPTRGGARRGPATAPTGPGPLPAGCSPLPCPPPAPAPGPHPRSAAPRLRRGPRRASAPRRAPAAPSAPPPARPAPGRGSAPCPSAALVAKATALRRGGPGDRRLWRGGLGVQAGPGGCSLPPHLGAPARARQFRCSPTQAAHRGDPTRL